MSRTVSFSFKSDEERREWEAFAACKGMTLSCLAKFALYQYRAKYGIKSGTKLSKVSCDKILYLIEQGTVTVQSEKDLPDVTGKS